MAKAVKRINTLVKRHPSLREVQEAWALGFEDAVGDAEIETDFPPQPFPVKILTR